MKGNTVSPPQGNRARKARRRLPPDIRRAQVLDAALRLLSTGGYAALSVEAIAREAGVSKTVVYDGFGGLPRVLRALLEREERRALQSLADAAPTLPVGTDPGEAVLAWASSLAQAIAANPVTWRLMLIPPEGTPEVVREHVQRGRDIALEQTRQLARAVLSERAGVAFDMELAARSLLAVAEEGAKLLLERPGEFPPGRLTEFASALLMTLGTRSAAE